MASKEDCDIVNGLKANDPICQRKLIDNYAGRLLAIVMKEGLSRQDAIEVVNDTFLKIIQKINLFNLSKNCKLSSWIIKIAINSARDKLRQNNRLLDFHSLDDLCDKGFQGTKTLWNDESQAESNTCQLSKKILIEALENLNESDQDILRLFSAGYHYNEIAPLLNKSAGAVKVAHFRAKARLRQNYIKILEASEDKTAISAVKAHLSIEHANEKAKN